MKSLRYTISFFLLVCFLSVTGQTPDDPYQVHPFPKIMLIPYQPANFNSDVNLSGKVFRRKPRGFVKINANDHFRRNLDKALFDKLLTYFDVNRISFYENEGSKKDLQTIYSSITYNSQKKRLKSYYKNYTNFNVFQMIGIGTSKWGVNCIEQKRGKPVKRLKKFNYTDVVIQDSNLLPHLNAQYACSYYLFVNQIDLYSRFKICSDLLKNVQQKDILLHFTLIDQNGSKVTGGLVAVTYNPGNGRNSILEVVEKNMEILADLVTDDLQTQLGLSLQYFQ